MAISINGNGTITGLSAGGLPSGSVTSATLADGAATGSKLGSGSIIQTQSFLYTATTTQFTGQNWHASPITKQITPTSASNKILVMATLCAGNEAVGEGAAFKIMRSINGGSYAESDALGDAAGSANRGAVGGVYDENIATHTDCRSTQFIDNPGTALAIDYKMYVFVFDSSKPILINRPYTTSALEQITGTSSLILMEIAA